MYLNAEVSCSFGFFLPQLAYPLLRQFTQLHHYFIKLHNKKFKILGMKVSDFYIQPIYGLFFTPPTPPPQKKMNEAENYNEMTPQETKPNCINKQSQNGWHIYSGCFVIILSDTECSARKCFKSLLIIFTYPT